MKISRVEVDLSDLEPSDMEEQESRTETVSVDEKSGLQSKWQLAVEDYDGEDKFFLNIRLLNYKDFQNENVVAFGTAYLDCEDGVEHEPERIDLPVRHLHKLTSDIVWCFEEDVNSEYSPYSFHASISLVYNEPTKMQSDFSDLLESGMHSDVVLMADQETFKVHKNIISARSVVFSRMFENDMKEKQEGKVEIEDIRGPVLREMLKFMYTGKLAPTIAREAGILEDLCVAADKYDVQDLKGIVAEKLLEGINAGNAEKRLAVAEQFGDLILREKCLKIMQGGPVSTSSKENANLSNT